MKAFHFLEADMRPGSGSSRQRPWKIGDRRTIRGGVIEPCLRGYHGSPTLYDALRYAPGPVACIVDLGDDAIPHGNPVDKYASRSRTLLAAVNVERELRLFAADCAERVLPIFEAAYPDDKRPREAIKVARRFANGKATSEELASAAAAAYAANAAASDAAYAAAYANAAAYAAINAAYYASNASYAAAYAAYAARYAAYYASDAAYSYAAYYASDASDAAYSNAACYASNAAAGRLAEPEWLRQRLDHYLLPLLGSEGGR